MRILEKKDWATAWKKVCTCPQCESKLEAEPADIVCNPSSGGNQHDYCPEYFYLRCPVCSQQISLSDKDIPEFLKKQARDRANRGSYFDR